MSIRLRPVLALALCAGLAGATGLGTASAAAQSCNLVTDDKGDAKGAAGAVSDPVVDILSADVASNAKKITAVIRVEKLAATSANYSLGITWRANFTIGDTTYAMSAISDRSGVVGQTSYSDPATGQGTIAGSAVAVLDMAKNEVRITSSTVGFADRVNIKPGTAVTDLNVLTGGIFQSPKNPVVNFNLRYASADTATGGKTYKAANPSCVAVGK